MYNWACEYCFKAHQKPSEPIFNFRVKLQGFECVCPVSQQWPLLSKLQTEPISFLYFACYSTVYSIFIKNMKHTFDSVNYLCYVIHWEMYHYFICFKYSLFSIHRAGFPPRTTTLVSLEKRIICAFAPLFRVLWLSSSRPSC